MIKIRLLQTQSTKGSNGLVTRPVFLGEVKTNLTSDRSDL